MLAWISSRSTVLSNNRSLPTAQLSLPSAHYALHLVHKTSSCLLVIKTTLPRVAFACWVLFIAFPARLFSTSLILIRSLLLHIARSLLALLSLLLTPPSQFFAARNSSLLAALFLLFATRFLFLICHSLLSAFSMFCSLFPGFYLRVIFYSCYLLIRCLLVLTRCYLSLIATDRPRLVLATRCSRTVKSGLQILCRCSLCAASLSLPPPRISLSKRFAIFYLLWAPVTPNQRNFDHSRL